MLNTNTYYFTSFYGRQKFHVVLCPSLTLDPGYATETDCFTWTTRVVGINAGC